VAIVNALQLICYNIKMLQKVAINTVTLHCHLRPPFLPLVLRHEWRKLYRII